MIAYTSPCCPVCGSATEVLFTEEEWKRYQTIKFIQDALPHWSADKRELLLTGTHPECWDEMFGEEE